MTVARRPSGPRRWTDDLADVRPMLATPHDRPTEDSLRHSGWIYEVKYDGMRALVFLEPAEPLARVVLRSRRGHDKTTQFPDVVRGLRQFGRKLKRPVLLDGELVALDSHGDPLGFQQLAGRIHLTSDGEIAAEAGRMPVAYFAFDILRDGGDDLRDLPLVDRKARLEKVFGNAASELVRMTETASGDGSRLYERVRKTGGEGLIGKEAHSCYDSGRRSPAWRKLKLLRQQEFVVCGWTMPRESRKHFGSLVLGYYAGPEGARHLKYAGTAGSGFTDAELDRVWRLLSARAQEECPFSSIPPTPERARWVRPELVAQVRFTEWTRDGVLRHPVYLGLRPDMDANTITREEDMSAPAAPRTRTPSTETETKPPGTGSSTVRARVATGSRPSLSATRRRSRSEAVRATTAALDDAGLAALVTQLEQLEDSRRDGALHLPDGSRIDVGNLAKIFWPIPRLTKGALMRHYVRIAPWLLPGLADRPLVMKRFPNGVAGKSFYQQRAPDDVPAGVRVEQVQEDDEVRPRIVGGSLATLLYTTQLAAISQDPWFSRLAAPGLPDYVALDLDPMPGVPFAQVREVARAVRDELLALDVPALAKTSGSSGLHVYIPLAAGTPYEAGQLFCQIIATMVAAKLPRVATVERAVARRGRTVYIDYLQNILGKTLATAYSARASEFAGVSTPLGWHELDEPFDPQDFTLETVIARFRETGDLWAPMHTGRRLDLREALERLAR